MNRKISTLDISGINKKRQQEIFLQVAYRNDTLAISRIYITQLFTARCCLFCLCP